MVKRLIFDVERVGAPGGAFAALGTELLYVPGIMILDNKSAADVQVSVDGVNTWKTFAAAEALVLDLRGNDSGIAVGTQFYIKGAGAGTFNLSLLNVE